MDAKDDISTSSTPDTGQQTEQMAADYFMNLPTKNLFRLDKRTIAITGGHGALGMTIAAACLEMGADVICLDHQQEKTNKELFSVVRRKAEKYGSNAWFYHDVDVTDSRKLHDIFKHAMEKVRYPLRGLVTCAGISGEAPAVSYPEDRLKRIMDVNFNGTLYAAQVAYKWFRQQGTGGSVVLVASMSGHIANRDLPTSAYNASKAAVLQLTRNLAMEWSGRDADRLPVRVNSLSPGHIRTPIAAEALAAGAEKKWADLNMLGRISEAVEYRAPVLFLLGDGSSFMTGQDLKVDGGHTAW